jgi:hypothetical protein
VFVWSVIRLPAVIHAEQEAERAKLAAQIDRAAAKRAVREGLAEFLAEGSQLMEKLGATPPEATEEDASAWYYRAVEFIKTELDNSYIARMGDHTMLPPKYGAAPGTLPNVWMAVRAYNFHIAQFVRELATTS